MWFYNQTNKMSELTEATFLVSLSQLPFLFGINLLVNQINCLLKLITSSNWMLCFQTTRVIQIRTDDSAIFFN